MGEKSIINQASVFYPLLKAVGRNPKTGAQHQLEAWREEADVANVVETAWRKSVKAAVKKFEPTPKRPPEADPGAEPHVPRLVINDSTIKKLARISLSGPTQGLPHAA